jgi:HD-GYP domain-containing protein (c-di-GMP phosphodiesterase class II)
MIERRPYREPLSVEDALAELRRSAGSQFDPDLVEQFVEIVLQRDPAAATA